MSITVRGGEEAIDASHRLLEARRRGDPAVPELSAAQVREQLGLAVDRAMAEGSLYDRGLAAQAIKQAEGDLVEAAFLLRAYRTTVPRLGFTEAIDTTAMLPERRIAPIFKDLPGGQMLGATYDYTHRLLDPEPPPAPFAGATPEAAGPVGASRRAVDFLLDDCLVVEERPDDTTTPFDLTRDPIAFPPERDARLQTLARGEEGFVTAMAYSTMRGYGRAHPMPAELRSGEVVVELIPPELGYPIPIGAVTVTECEMVTQFREEPGEQPRFTRGYGLVFGRSERKAIAMALVDRALQTRELGEDVLYPAQDEEFVLSHADGIDAAGLVQHLKLPHYVDFQAAVQLLRSVRERVDASEPEAVPA